jgi:hypothetical protein
LGRQVCMTSQGIVCRKGISRPTYREPHRTPLIVPIAFVRSYRTKRPPHGKAGHSRPLTGRRGVGTNGTEREHQGLVAQMAARWTRAALMLMGLLSVILAGGASVRLV